MDIKFTSLLALYGAALIPMVMVFGIRWASSSERKRIPNTGRVSEPALLIQSVVVILFLVSISLFGNTRDFQLLMLGMVIVYFTYAIPYRLLRHRRFIVIPKKYQAICHSLAISGWFLVIVALYLVFRINLPGFPLDLSAHSYPLVAVVLSVYVVLVWLARAVNTKIRREEPDEYSEYVANQFRHAEHTLSLLEQSGTLNPDEHESKMLDFQSTLVRINESLGIRLSDRLDRKTTESRMPKRWRVWVGVGGSYVSTTVMAYGVYQFLSHLPGKSWSIGWSSALFAIVLWIVLCGIITRFWQAEWGN